ncbi:MAG: asparaginase [Candidatus Cloacimonadaceae bacterium]|jgi:L-asparaginase|nr:asparaginase [Candidatus Cloacimonadota bacterium]MCK9177474.1 asparaginase [Candidatus Cloacimonadota bacterium]MDD3102706.1 asparaginase [Candidatus Cloacimonadota bacterium]MDD3534084.1 asparaginase [Candidatus Cloacimonadota bacterium]MDY0126639.1 asparaginase [Candidatus Cloacimonadaceae bacterium]
MKNNILLIMTGGTISMKNVGSLGVVPSSELVEFLKQFPQLDGVANVEVMDYLNVPSPYMSPQMMFDLAKLIDTKILAYDGIVITHGTDTLEESAFLADLVLTTRKPVVFTAAMRSGGDLGLDGPRNIIGSVRVASHTDSFDKGVLVVMNDEIHTARDVVKFDAGKLDAFTSPGLGPLGIVDPDLVMYHRESLYRENVWTQALDTRVDLIKAVSGMDGRYIDCSIESGSRAIVIEAFGRGNLPKDIIPYIQKALDRDILVVIASRTDTGRVLPEYGYKGGGKNLRDMGAILAGDLKGIKIRLKLMALFGKYGDADTVRRFLTQAHEME